MSKDDSCIRQASAVCSDQKCMHELLNESMLRTLNHETSNSHLIRECNQESAIVKSDIKQLKTRLFHINKLKKKVESDLETHKLFLTGLHIREQEIKRQMQANKSSNSLQTASDIELTTLGGCAVQ